MSAPARPVFVVGCPRSGTSPFARWLDACGLAGAEDRRRAARYPAGYYEHVPILMFHKALERGARGSDHAVTTAPFLTREQLEDPFVRGMFEAAFEPVREGEFEFVKFPQLALSIDFLLEQFPEAHVIALWRAPAPTFRSLVTREFPREMIPASGVKAILLWNTYAHHIVAAARTHPERVSALAIERFLADPEVGRALLRRLGRDPARAVPPEAAVDRGLWKDGVPMAWGLYHRAMRGVTRTLRSRLGPERAPLADQRAWLAALRALPAPGDA